MHSITIENFRCFGKRQTAHLAPLTLLVGENSTGKTSFLALLRALDDLAHNAIPNFKQPPYDLGSFDEIPHYRGGRAGRAKTFGAEIAALPAIPGNQDEWKLTVQFDKDTKETCSSACLSEPEFWIRSGGGWDAGHGVR
ncbi:AAA family ATPase, partial [Candidatus Synechococcus spongiarum]